MSNTKDENKAKREILQDSASSIRRGIGVSDAIGRKLAKIRKKPKKSIDSAWSDLANLCLFSYRDSDDKEVFASTRETRDKYGKGREDSFADYLVFVPDAIVNRIAGKIGKARKKSEVLVAYIDGSYSFSDQKGCCAYSVFFQVGDRIAEYANTVCDDDRRYGATAAELMAAIVAIKVAIFYGYKHIELRHDYTGVAFFSMDSGSNPNKRSKMYWVFSQYEAFLTCARELIDIKYTKVKSHSLDVGNEHADFLARTFSKRARRESDETLARIEGETYASEQMIAFAKNNDIDFISYESVERKMESKQYQSHFDFTEVELNLIKKMLRDASTMEIMESCLLSRKMLAEHRRNIVVKLGMPADAAADNTIVKRTLNWLYLGRLNAKSASKEARKKAYDKHQQEQKPELPKEKRVKPDSVRAQENINVASRRGARDAVGNHKTPFSKKHPRNRKRS